MTSLISMQWDDVFQILALFGGLAVITVSSVVGFALAGRLNREKQ